MAGLVPAIHAFEVFKIFKTWMPATSAGMTIPSPNENCRMPAFAGMNGD
jgi:hypothetical protein